MLREAWVHKRCCDEWIFRHFWRRVRPHGRESTPWIRSKCCSYSYAAASCTCYAYRETEEWIWLLNWEESDQPYSRTYRLDFKHDCSPEARREHSFVHWSPLLKSSLKWKPLPSASDRRVITNMHNHLYFTCVNNLSRFKSTLIKKLNYFLLEAGDKFKAISRKF